MTPLGGTWGQDDCPDPLPNIPPRYRQHEASKRARSAIGMAAAAALAGGYRRGSRYEAPWKPWCDNPVTLTLRALKKAEAMIKQTVEVSHLAPCRKCEKCRLFRALQWRDRALVEIERAAKAGRRTWMVTLTFSPTHLAGVLIAAKAGGRDAAIAGTEQVWSEEKGTVVDGATVSLKPDEPPGGWQDRVEPMAYREAQRYLKRLRKAGMKFRFLAVFERGEETGRPHFHLLLSEVDRPVLKAQLEGHWPSNVHARLVAGRARGAASYVVKYATKDLRARIRASIGYGTREAPTQTVLVGGPGTTPPSDASQQSGEPRLRPEV